MLHQFDFEGPILAEAISKTFSTRGTNIQSEPIALTNSFAEDAGKAAQWRGFVRKNRLKDVPQNFIEVVTGIAAFLGPIAENLVDGLFSKATWKAPAHGANDGINSAVPFSVPFSQRVRMGLIETCLFPDEREHNGELSRAAYEIPWGTCSIGVGLSEWLETFTPKVITSALPSITSVSVSSDCLAP